MKEEKRQLQEQLATHTYNRPVSSASRSSGERKMPGAAGPYSGVHTRQRVVTKIGRASCRERV